MEPYEKEFINVRIENILQGLKLSDIPDYSLHMNIVMELAEIYANILRRIDKSNANIIEQYIAEKSIVSSMEYEQIYLAGIKDGIRLFKEFS